MNPISINEPCHENWSAMTPSKQGAFCGKCQIDVIDFSGKSPSEVKSILQENAGKHLCGRFKKTQLDDLNEAWMDWDNQSPKIFQSKFLYACLLVFGMTLFSCNTPQDMAVGEISLENTTPVEQVDPVGSEKDQKTNGNKDDRKYLQDDPKYLKGKIAYNPSVKEETNCNINNENEYIKGDVAYIPESEYLMGQAMILPDSIFADEIITEEPQIIITPHSETVISADPFRAKIYPNPTGTFTSLLLTVQQTGIYSLELFSISGQKVFDVFSGELTRGESIHHIDLSACKNGTYLLYVRCGDQLETFKIVKAD